MPKPDQVEIEAQSNEIVKAGLAEEYCGKDFPRYCSPAMLVDKEKNKSEKTSKTKRMCFDYRKLNQRTQLHVGSLPNMEDAIETLCKFKYKCKLDMRSGFWQVSLSERARELCSFITPSGRVFKPLVMPFGLSNAPPIFQELMEKVIAICKQREEVKPLFDAQKIHLGAFFDDSALGAQSKDHLLLLLDIWLDVCESNNLRVKLSKCQLMEESMEYLDFVVGNHWLKPSENKVQSILTAKVNNLATLRSFLGAANFLRRHVRNFTFSSAILTNLLKHSNKWEWTSDHENAFNELKGKIADAKGLGVPQPKGEILLVTDSSNLGGGASM